MTQNKLEQEVVDVLRYWGPSTKEEIKEHDRFKMFDQELEATLSDLIYKEQIKQGEPRGVYRL